MFLHGRACALVLAGQPDACRRDVMARAGFESKFRSFSLVLLAGCRARSLIRFCWFRAHFCHRALAAAETNFSARFFFPCLFKHAALSSSHLPHPES